MKQQTPEQRYRISLRINRDLLEEMRQAAQRDSRTINSYLLHLLRQDLARQAPPKKK